MTGLVLAVIMIVTAALTTLQLQQQDLIKHHTKMPIIMDYYNSFPFNIVNGSIHYVVNGTDVHILGQLRYDGHVTISTPLRTYIGLWDNQSKMEVSSSGPNGPNQVFLKSPPINPGDTMAFDFDTKLTEKQAVQQFPYLLGRIVVDNLVITG